MTQQPSIAERRAPQGIGGWLLLIVLALVLSCAFGLVIEYLLVVGIFQNSGNKAMSVLIFQCVTLVSNFLVFLFVPMKLLHLLFTRSRNFPFFAQVWALSAPLCFIAAIFIITFLEGRAESGVDQRSQDIVGIPIWWFVAIFVYLGKSKRVKNTFVRINPGSDRVLA